jgi:DegV family protein with EDD domain
MKIVTDSGVDLCLTPEEAAGLAIHSVPLTVSLQGRTFRGGLHISNENFYSLLESTNAFPTTSQPSPGAFAEVYRELAAVDPDILSIHSSAGVSGTLNAAKLEARLVPEAHVRFLDTRTFSIAAGWQVEAAAMALRHGWSYEKTLLLVNSIADATEVMFTLKELRFLIHGGRISHIKGLLANLFQVKPIIGFDKVHGTYVQLGEARSLPQSFDSMVRLMELKHGPGAALRVQIAHASNPEGAAMLRKLVDTHFMCTWLPECSISLVLGAHAGSSVVGLAYAPAAAFADMP